jgi:PKD domain
MSLLHFTKSTSGMKNALLSIILFFILMSAVNAQPVVSTFGVPAKNDYGAKIIHTSDNFYIVAGQMNNNAALYKYDCNGTIVDSLIYDFPADGSYESFKDIIELPGGDFLAAGDAFSVDGVFRHSFVLRATSGLEEITSDTIRIFGQLSYAKQLEISPDGRVIMAGEVPGIFLDYSDIYVVEIDPATLLITDSITKFNYGVDQVTGLSLMPNGHIILSGYSVTGNIFDVEALLQNTAWTRVINNTGGKVWDNKRVATFKNAYGRMRDNNALWNPETGNIIVGGNTYSGDTLNPLDAHFMVFSQSGTLLSTYTCTAPGSQNIMDMQIYGDQDVTIIAIGDSTGAKVHEENVAFMFTIRFAEANGLITQQAPASLAFPVRFNSVVPVPAFRFAFAGIRFTTPYAASNQDGFVAIPAIGVTLSQTNNQLQVTTNPTGNYSYQWYNNNQQTAITADASFTAVNNGTYTVQVVDNQGCRGKSENSIIVNTSSEIVELFMLYNDTVCTNYALNNVINPIGGAATYSWAFSDGAISSQSVPNHSFTAPGNYAASLTVTTISREPYFSITDPVPDLYILVKNNQGQEIYRSDVHYDVTAFELPYTIPAIFLVKNEFYIIEIWDYDAFDSDDFLGEVFLSNPTIPGTYSTGAASISINPEDAETSYTWSRDIHIIAPYIVNNNGVLAAKLDKTGSFTYIWYHNNIQIASGISDTLIPPATEGCYTVKILGGNLCDETSAPYCFTVGTNESQKSPLNGIVIAPQPIKPGQNPQVLLNEPNMGIILIELFSPIGQMLLSESGTFNQPVFSLPTSNLHLSSGIYILRFTQENGHSASKNIWVAEY